MSEVIRCCDLSKRLIPTIRHNEVRDITHQPESCACGKSFDVNHAMICPKGGFPTIRHNEVHDITADLLTEICHNVEAEPKLQPVTGERLSHRQHRR